MTKKPQTRREFCTRACQAASLATLAGALGAVLPACGSNGGPTSPGSGGGGGGLSALPVIGASESGGAVVLDVGADSPLASVGAAAIVQTQSRFLLVGHTAQDAFTALSAICTHETCTITEFANQTYVCPCHGSRFDLQGRVLAGPAFSSLRQYGTQLANGQLTVSL